MCSGDEHTSLVGHCSDMTARDDRTAGAGWDGWVRGMVGYGYQVGWAGMGTCMGG